MIPKPDNVFVGKDAEIIMLSAANTKEAAVGDEQRRSGWKLCQRT